MSGPVGARPVSSPEDSGLVGARLVSSLEHRAMTAIVRHHHERIDGSGYERGSLFIRASTERVR